MKRCKTIKEPELLQVASYVLPPGEFVVGRSHLLLALALDGFELLQRGPRCGQSLARAPHLLPAPPQRQRLRLPLIPAHASASFLVQLAAGLNVRRHPDQQDASGTLRQVSMSPIRLVLVRLAAVLNVRRQSDVRMQSGLSSCSACDRARRCCMALTPVLILPDLALQWIDMSHASDSSNDSGMGGS